MCERELHWIPRHTVSAAHAHTTNGLIDEELLHSLPHEELLQVFVSRLILHQSPLSVRGPVCLSPAHEHDS